MDVKQILATLNIQDNNPGVMIGTEAFGSGPIIESYSPVDGEIIASLTSATDEDYERACAVLRDSEANAALPDDFDPTDQDSKTESPLS